VTTTATGSSSAIPPAAELVLAFVNTRADGAGRKELFGGAEALAAWLAEHHRAVASATVTDADAATARELRDALVAVMLAHSGDVDPAGEDVRAAEAHLSRAGMLYPLVPLITEQGVRLVSPQDGVAHAFGSVLAAVTEFAQSGEWGRLKACRNPPCHFGFFDRTRNGSGLYCSTGCGAQVGMRRYRERQRNST
jgi:predicted RNA-binding Zn ribbon-like protein